MQPRGGLNKYCYRTGLTNYYHERGMFSIRNGGTTKARPEGSATSHPDTCPRPVPAGLGLFPKRRQDQSVLRAARTAGSLATPTLLLGLPVARLARAGLTLVAAADDRGFLVIVGNAEFTGFQAPDLVAQAAGFLEFEVGGGIAHLLFELLDIGAQVVADEVVLALGIDVHQHAVAAGRIRHDIGDAALDRLRGDAVFGVVFFLLGPAAVGFRDGAFHAAGHAVGIEDHAAIHVTRGAADGLDQR
ncbi:hypothetical protein COLO4_02235, partial [Corchorus olitorius]